MVKIAGLAVSMAMFLTACKEKTSQEAAAPQRPVTITAVSAAESGSGEEGSGGSGLAEETYSVSQVLAYCNYSDAGLRLMIHLNVDPARIGEGNTAYFLVAIPDPEAGTSVVIDQDHTRQAMIFIRPTSEPAPKLTDTPVNYTTRQSQGTFTNKRPPSSCEFTFKEVDKAGGLTSGSLKCEDMAQFDEISNAELIPMGEILDLSADWQCDHYH